MYLLQVYKNELVINTPDILVIWVGRVTNILLKYNEYFDFMDKEAAFDLRL